MTTALFDHGRPMTELEYLALGETSDRIELLDGSLLVSSGPSVRHQRILRRLANALEDAAEAVGLDVDLGLNVRLQTDRIFIPDFIISAGVDSLELVVDVTKVRLVGEILSPSNAATDKVIKMNYYAAAGIPWYLLVEQQDCVFRLYRLAGTTYVEHSVTSPGEIFRLTDPVVVAIDPADVRPPY